MLDVFAFLILSRDSHAILRGRDLRFWPSILLGFLMQFSCLLYSSSPIVNFHSRLSGRLRSPRRSDFLLGRSYMG